VGKVLGTTATGVWGPVTPPTGLPQTTGDNGDVLTVVGGAPAWQPPTENGYWHRYTFVAGVPLRIDHNFNQQWVFVRVYDSADKEISAEITLTDVNSCHVTVSEAGTYVVTVFCPTYRP
jgi:hypothetical protein